MTLSILVLVALCWAVLFQFLRPINPPEVLAISGPVRLDGRTIAACWPQRDGELKCSRPDTDETRMTVRGEGMFRLVVAYPAQPEDGQITIVRGQKTVNSEDDWTRELDYDLDPGDYVLDVQARYPLEAFIHVRFPFRVTRSGK